MKLTISRPTQFKDLEPGATAIGDNGVRCVIDEVSRTIDGIRVYARPVHRPEGRRGILIGEPDATILIVPDADEAVAALKEAISAGAGAWTQSGTRARMTTDDGWHVALDVEDD